MFDKINLSENTPYAKTVTKTVTENKAPTDESMRLLSEFQGEAYKSILATMESKDNGLNFNAIFYTHPYGFKTVCEYTFYLNGVQFEGMVSSDRMDTLVANEAMCQFMKKIREDVAQKIADALDKSIGQEFLIYLREHDRATTG